MAERKLKKALDAAWESMTPEDKDKLLSGLSLKERDITSLVAREPRWGEGARSRAIGVIKKIIDLNKFATYPARVPVSRPATEKEWEILNPLFKKVEDEMRRIGNGAEDAYVEAVFGKEQMARAKDIFKGSADALNRLRTSKKVLIDNLQKLEVWGCGGLTNQNEMTLPPSFFQDISQIGTAKSGKPFLTIVHESTHAATPDVTTDELYDYHENFKNASEQMKVTTARLLQRNGAPDSDQQKREVYTDLCRTP